MNVVIFSFVYQDTKNYLFYNFDICIFKCIKWIKGAISWERIALRHNERERILFVSKQAGKSRIAYLGVEWHAANCASTTKSGEMFIPPASKGKMFIPPASRDIMFIPPDTWLSAANYALPHNETFSTNWNMQ